MLTKSQTRIYFQFRNIIRQNCQKSDFRRFCEIHKTLSNWPVELKVVLYAELNDVCKYRKFQLNRLNRSWDTACLKSRLGKVGFSKALPKTRIKTERIHIFLIGFNQNASNTCFYHRYENGHNRRNYYFSSYLVTSNYVTTVVTIYK